MPALANARYEKFVQERAKGLSIDAAYAAAGFNPNRSNASRLSQRPEVQERLAEVLGNIAEKVGITQARVLEELARIGFSDIRKLFTEHGHIRRVEDLDDDAAAALSSVEVVTRRVPGSDRVDPEYESVTKIKLWDKKGALVDIGKHLGMFKETPPEPPQVNINIGDTELARLIAFQLTKASKEV